MTEHYRFFDSEEGDVREYLAAEFAEYFSRFLGDGLYTEDGQAGLKVTPDTGLQVKIAPGYAFIRGYMYKNDEPLTFNLDPADTMLDRIDRVILRFDEVAREIKVILRKGHFSSTPGIPTLETSTKVKELGLAQIYIKSKMVNITVTDITDERLTDACGLVSSLITIPAQEMWDVWNQTLGRIENAWNVQTGQIAEAWNMQTGNVNGEWGQLKSAWEDWFYSVQNTNGVRIMIGEDEPDDLQVGDLWFRVV